MSETIRLIDEIRKVDNINQTFKDSVALALQYYEKNLASLNHTVKAISVAQDECNKDLTELMEAGND